MVLRKKLRTRAASNGYASEVPTFVKKCDTAVAMGLILEIVTRATNVHTNPYSTKSSPCSLPASFSSDTHREEVCRACDLNNSRGTACDRQVTPAKC